TRARRCSSSPLRPAPLPAEERRVSAVELKGERNSAAAGTGSAPPLLSSSAAAEIAAALRANVERALRGKPEVVRRTVEALLAGGPLLLEDVPGVGKTTLAQALARSIDASFRRIQFTSDLLPSDVLGASLPAEAAPGGARRLVFHPGPIFANV